MTDQRELRFWKARARELERVLERFREQQRELAAALPAPYSSWVGLDPSQLRDVAPPLDARVLCGESLDDEEESELQQSDVVSELRQVWRRLG